MEVHALLRTFAVLLLSEKAKIAAAAPRKTIPVRSSNLPKYQPMTRNALFRLRRRLTRLTWLLISDRRTIDRNSPARGSYSDTISKPRGFTLRVLCHCDYRFRVMTGIILGWLEMNAGMRTILAAVDQSRNAHSVIGRAAELASLLRTELVILTVLDPDPMRKFSIDEERNRIASFHRELIFKHFPKKGISVESNNPSEPVYSAADHLKADLVIVGNRGLGGVGGLVLGSVSERVVHKCSRSVMVVKGGGESNSSDWESIVASQQAHLNLGTG
ncbi:universal stress protein [Candidatus Bathyarchaeota archaeon]|nr:MAG: universal stress protein [Candidatus Bathyarchaeota archaeon]